MATCILCHCPVSGGGNRHRKGHCGLTAPKDRRKIHYGETEERGIRGQASRKETEALMEEGIAVMPLPLPEGLKGPLQ